MLSNHDLEHLETMILKDVSVRNITIQKLESKLIDCGGQKREIIKRSIEKQHSLIAKHLDCIKKIRKLGVD